MRANENQLEAWTSIIARMHGEGLAEYGERTTRELYEKHHARLEARRATLEIARLKIEELLHEPTIPELLAIIRKQGR